MGPMKSKPLLYLGGLIPFVFFGTTFIAGIIQGNYNHLSRMVSELGTIGTSSQYVFMAGLLACSALSVLFIVGLYRACKAAGLNAWPVLLMLSYSFSIAGAALFPLPLRLHGILGAPSILLLLSPVLSLALWRRGEPKHIVWMSIASLLVMSLGLLTFLPDFMPDYMGLKQRFFHIGWSVWFGYLSYGFVKLAAGARPVAVVG
jgi:Protein of unknown function (DUF998)